MLLVFLKWDFLVSFSSFFPAYLPQEKSGHTVPEEEKKKRDNKKLVKKTTLGE